MDEDRQQLNNPLDATTKSILRKFVETINATIVQKGLVKITPAPVNPAEPIALGENSTVLPVYEADAGSDDTYVITADPALTAYTQGQIISFKANTANTGACTLNVNGLGTKSIKKLHDQNPADNDIEAGQIVTVVYDGTNFQMQSQIANAPTTPPVTIIETFTGSGTWNKPSGAIAVKVQVWGAGGGGGGVSGNGDSGGGGGGAYKEFLFDADDLGSTETITVDNGGNGGAVGNNDGVAGGDTTFGSLVIAYGGGAGSGSGGAGTGKAGGGGGGLSVGGDGTSGGTHGGGGTPGDGTQPDGYGGADGGIPGIDAVFGGGGGAGTSGAGVATAGGKSIFGGGGGGAGANGAGGVSEFGGDGGTSPTNATGDNGTTPAGGGSGVTETTGSGNYAGGDGGAGQVIVTTYV